MFVSLTIPQYRRYASGIAASNVGTWMHRIGQSWLVLQLTGSPAVLGLTTALQFAPMLFVGPWAGALTDRTDRRRLLIWTQAALALQAAVLAIIVLSGAATTAIVLASALVLGVVTALDAPARQSFVSDLVDHEHLPNAVALNGSSFNAARLLGPAVAGLVIAAWGTGWVFAINAATFTVFIAVLARLRVRPVEPVAKGSATVLDGLRFVLGRPDLLVVIGVAGLVSMFALNFQVTIAVMSTEQFEAGPEVFGVLASVMAVGSLAGSLLAAKRNRTSIRLVVASGMALGLLTAMAGLAPDAWFFAGALALCGLAALLMMTGANAYLQTHAGARHRGRVMALYLAVFFGTTPLGAPAVGWLMTSFGPRAGLILPGLLAAATALGLGLLHRRLRDRRALAQVVGTPNHHLGPASSALDPAVLPAKG